ncbi:hypothetical protein BH18ACT5_BH18ACT5_05330 [soil metagenome]
MTRNVGSVWRRLLAGAGLGLLWGVGMRSWMRFISTEPEFSWSGTLFIVGATTIAGTLTGLAYHRWQLGRGSAWRLLALSYLPLGTAAGSVMLPSFVIGGLALGRTRWPSWVRILLGLVAVGFQVFAFAGGVSDIRAGRAVAALAIYAVFLGIETWAFSIMARPRHQTAVPVAETRSQLPVSADG